MTIVVAAALVLSCLNGLVSADIVQYAADNNVSVETWIEVRDAMFTSQASSAFRSTPSLTVRKEVREMTCKEWDAYVSAVKKLYESEEWETFARVHDNERQLIWDLSHSDARQRLYTFLPWHRLWLRGIERELQKIDPDAAIPYWNWALDSADPLKSPVLSDMYFGSNGDPNHDNCVVDGAFANQTTAQQDSSTAGDEIASGSSGCIRRYLPEQSGGFLNLVNIKDILVGCEDFDSFNLCIENGPGLYGYMHMFLGGDEAQNSNDPLFLSMYAFVDMLWWKWQRMHNSIDLPTIRGNPEEILLPFEEEVEDVFSVEEMGYTYSSPLENTDQTQQAAEGRSCYVEEKGGSVDIVLLGHQIFEKLPSNISELVMIPRKTPLLSVDVWKQWVQLKLNHHQVPTAMELEGDLKLWAHLASWPSFNSSNWNSEEDYGLGIPISMVIPEFFWQYQITGGNVSRNFCDSLPLEDREDKRCVVQRPKTKWYLNTFHHCVVNKLKEDYGAEFEYLSYEANADDIDEKVLEEADSLLSRVLYDVVDPIVKYEDTRYIVMSNEGEDKFVEVEAVEGEGSQLFQGQDREVIPTEVDPLDGGKDLYNLADDFKLVVPEGGLPSQQQQGDSSSSSSQSAESQQQAMWQQQAGTMEYGYWEALSRVQDIMDRAYELQFARRSGWRNFWNQQNFFTALTWSRR